MRIHQDINSSEDLKTTGGQRPCAWIPLTFVNNLQSQSIKWGILKLINVSAFI